MKVADKKVRPPLGKEYVREQEFEGGGQESPPSVIFRGCSNSIDLSIRRNICVNLRHLGLNSHQSNLQEENL